MDYPAPQKPFGDEFWKLRNQIKEVGLPADLKEKLLSQLDRLEKMVQYSGYRFEFDKELDYLKFAASLPFNKSSPDILDIQRTAQILDKNHYGLKVVKERILEYLAVLILNSRQGRSLRAPILAFVGLVGSGKTSLAYSIAEALGRQIIRIPLGGLGSVKELKGQSLSDVEAEPGVLLKGLQKTGVSNPVVLLDEVDRVASEARADVMGVLVEILDPEQNFAFVDRYVDSPFDLSKILFIATANNTANIATAVMDRLEIIEMPSYNDQEKITIGKEYLLPKALKEAGLTEKVLKIEDELWPLVVRPLGYDAGIRSLQRHIQELTRKVAKKVVEGNSGPFVLSNDNIGKYLE